MKQRLLVRSRPVLRAFVLGTLSGLVLFGLYLGFGAVESLGWVRGILITVGLSAGLGLLWALIIALRPVRGHAPWAWTTSPTSVIVRTPSGDELLTVTADVVRGRKRADAVDTLTWEQIERVEVHAERDVMGPYGRSFWREVWSGLLPVEIHQPLSLRWTVKGEAFQRRWVLSDGTSPTSPEDVSRLSALMKAMEQAGSKERRAHRLAASVRDNA